jgi:hypothetical protein
MGPVEQAARVQLELIKYCHLCDCKIGWLHNATAHWAGEYIDHEPFLEDSCATCWASIAQTTYSLLREMLPPS